MTDLRVTGSPPWRRLRGLLADGSAMLAILAGFVLVWELYVRAFEVRPFILPAPSVIASRIVRDYPELFTAAVATAKAFVGGFAVAALCAIVVSVVIVAFPRMGRGLYPLIIGSQTVPVIAIAPLLIIWLGFGLLTKLTVAAIVAFFPIVIGTVAGFRSVSPSAVDLMRSIPASRVAIFRRLLFPSALPSMFAGLRTGAVLSVIGAVVGEFVAGGDGLASDIVLARAQFQTDRVMADIVGLAVLGSAFYGLIALIERLAMPWRVRSVRSRRLPLGRRLSAARS